ncbi:hypothetical protein PR048_024342 [Dryococelus australis]|uniref:Uncharacterized protein n=1 Tax=Dryococelus australis TaxID=614101 RepID=A0ABQ9GNE3_9NEOP|nr:hypothetical protein PR048_024342 [Dryococelus australis]
MYEREANVKAGVVQDYRARSVECRLQSIPRTRIAVLVRVPKVAPLLLEHVPQHQHHCPLAALTPTLASRRLPSPTDNVSPLHLKRRLPSGAIVEDCIASSSRQFHKKSAHQVRHRRYAKGSELACSVLALLRLEPPLCVAHRAVDAANLTAVFHLPRLLATCVSDMLVHPSRRLSAFASDVLHKYWRIVDAIAKILNGSVELGNDISSRWRYDISRDIAPPLHSPLLPKRSGFSHAGIVPHGAAGGRVFSGISRFPFSCIQPLIHAHLTSPTSSLNTLGLYTIGPHSYSVELPIQSSAGWFSASWKRAGLGLESNSGYILTSNWSAVSERRLLTVRSSEPMGASMEQGRNEEVGETRDPRENSPTSGIVRHDSHLRKS